MHIIEPDDKRPVTGNALQQPADRPLDLLGRTTLTAGADCRRDSGRDLPTPLDAREPRREARFDVLTHHAPNDPAEGKDAGALAVGRDSAHRPLWFDPRRRK